MKKIIVTIAISLASLSVHASNTICTVNTYANPQGFTVGHIVAVPTLDLSKGQYSLIVKKDGTVIENAKYGDAMYAGVSAKYGDVTDAILIHLSRDQGSDNQGVNVLMASLSNNQKIAKVELSTSSKSNELFVNFYGKGLSIGCLDEVRP